MKGKKEYKIGDVVEYNGIRLKVAEGDCERCYFYQTGKCDECTMRMCRIVGPCDAWDRKDRKYVAYVKED